MSLIERLLGYRSFASVSEIVERVQQVKNETGPTDTESQRAAKRTGSNRVTSAGRERDEFVQDAVLGQEKQWTDRVRERADVPYGDVPASKYSTGGRPLLIFATSRQQTWLVLAGERLYFVLDDIRRSEPQIKKSVLLKDLKLQDGEIAVDVRPKSATTGLLDVGLRRRGWLYSKRLFAQESSIESAVHDLFGQITIEAGGSSPPSWEQNSTGNNEVVMNVGTKPGRGKYCCTKCNWSAVLDDDSDRLPPCGNCGRGQNTVYVRC